MTHPDGYQAQPSCVKYHLSIGWERVADGGGGFFVDAEFVFGRELEYEITPLDRCFDDALLIRGGISY